MSCLCLLLFGQSSQKRERLLFCIKCILVAFMCAFVCCVKLSFSWYHGFICYLSIIMECLLVI